MGPVPKAMAWRRKMENPRLILAVSQLEMPRLTTRFRVRPSPRCLLCDPNQRLREARMASRR